MLSTLNMGALLEHAPDRDKMVTKAKRTLAKISKPRIVLSREVIDELVEEEINYLCDRFDPEEIDHGLEAFLEAMARQQTLQDRATDLCIANAMPEQGAA